MRDRQCARTPGRLQSLLRRVLDTAAPIIAGQPFWGAVLFILVSALSAMLALFSSALLLPVALQAWGKTVCVLLEAARAR